MTLFSGKHLLATSKETKTKINTDFDIPLTEEGVKKRKEDKRLQEVIVSIDSPGEGPPGESPPGEGPPGKGPPGEGSPGEGPPAEGQGDCPGEQLAESLAAASLVQGPAAEGPAAKSNSNLGNIAQSIFFKYNL